MIYADTSALAKLVVAEDETPALRRWLEPRLQQITLVTNVIGEVELRRLAARLGQDVPRAAASLLAQVDILTLTNTALVAAAQLLPVDVRTLDALHVASAAELADLDSVLTYDLRMASAARGLGLPVVTPA
ncbi:MAG: type II toxin-antitoxin system VapC family toxin [Lapillicoccus sp.]